MPDNNEELQRCAAAAKNARAALDSATPPGEYASSTNLALAGLLAGFDHDPGEIGNHSLECALEAYVGAKLSRLIPDLLDIHAKLKSYTPETPLDLGGSDNYAFGLFDGSETPDEAEEDKVDAFLDEIFPGTPRSARKPAIIKVFGKQLQSYGYLVLLKEEYGRWQLHIRQFWPELDPKDSGSLDGLMRKLKKGTATAADLLANLAELGSYADSGAAYPRQPSLATFAKSGFSVGNDKAGPGLRYGDLRDPGYIASVKSDPLYDWTCDRPTVNWHRLQHVVYDLLSTRDCLAEK